MLKHKFSIIILLLLKLLFVSVNIGCTRQMVGDSSEPEAPIYDYSKYDIDYALNKLVEIKDLEYSEFHSKMRDFSLNVGRNKHFNFSDFWMRLGKELRLLVDGLSEKKRNHLFIEMVVEDCEEPAFNSFLNFAHKYGLNNLGNERILLPYFKHNDFITHILKNANLDIITFFAKDLSHLEEPSWYSSWKLVGSTSIDKCVYTKVNAENIVNILKNETNRLYDAENKVGLAIDIYYFIYKQMVLSPELDWLQIFKKIPSYNWEEFLESLLGSNIEEFVRGTIEDDEIHLLPILRLIEQAHGKRLFYTNFFDSFFNKKYVQKIFLERYSHGLLPNKFVSWAAFSFMLGQTNFLKFRFYETKIKSIMINGSIHSMIKHSEFFHQVSLCKKCFKENEKKLINEYGVQRFSEALEMVKYLYRSLYSVTHDFQGIPDEHLGQLNDFHDLLETTAFHMDSSSLDHLLAKRNGLGDLDIFWTLYKTYFEQKNFEKLLKLKEPFRAWLDQNQDKKLSAWDHVTKSKLEERLK